MLVALDGAWNLRQGPGAAYVAGTAIPLPAHAPVAVRFNYDSAQRLVHIVSADLANGIHMFPTATQQSAGAAAALADQPAFSSSCDWYALPTLIGTNVYHFVEEAHFERFAAADALCLLLGSMFCFEVPPSHHPGGEVDMQMTLILRFTSANSGSGVVIFSGDHEGYRFAAQAPVQISRN